MDTMLGSEWICHFKIIVEYLYLERVWFFREEWVISKIVTITEVFVKPSFLTRLHKMITDLLVGEYELQSLQ